MKGVSTKVLDLLINSAHRICYTSWRICIKISIIITNCDTALKPIRLECGYITASGQFTHFDNVNHSIRMSHTNEHRTQKHFILNHRFWWSISSVFPLALQWHAIILPLALQTVDVLHRLTPWCSIIEPRTM